MRDACPPGSASQTLEALVGTIHRKRSHGTSPLTFPFDLLSFLPPGTRSFSFGVLLASPPPLLPLKRAHSLRDIRYLLSRLVKSWRLILAGRAVQSTGCPRQESVLPVSLTVTARLLRPALSPRIDNPPKLRYRNLSSVQKGRPITPSAVRHKRPCQTLCLSTGGTTA